MNAMHGMNRIRKEVIQASTIKNDIKVQYLYDNSPIVWHCPVHPNLIASE